MDPKAEIQKLQHGEHWVWPESDYGRAEIWNLNGHLFVFEIPMYGGKPIFFEGFAPHRIDELIETVRSWA